MKDLISKDTAISFSVACIFAGAVWWAATVQSDISYMKHDLAFIRDKVEILSSVRVSER